MHAIVSHVTLRHQVYNEKTKYCVRDPFGAKTMS